MKIYAIADTHLSKAQPKPMSIFGQNWHGHPEILFSQWRKIVQPEDWVLIAGDISWALKMPDAVQDLQDLAALPGKKILTRGNHDYWWGSISKVRQQLPLDMYALQNDALNITEDIVVCGTRGWTCPETENFTPEDEKIYLREVERLRLTLRAAQKHHAKTTILMLHFPPTNAQFTPNGFTALIEEFKPSMVVYGHLHNINPERTLKHWGGIPTHYVASDGLKFVPKLLLNIP